MTRAVVVDLRAEPCILRPWQWSRWARRDPLELRGVAMHQWASPVGTTPQNRARYGEEVALARRGMATTYAINAGVTRGQVPVVGLVHPVERYTFSSDAANLAWISLGVMGLFAFDEHAVRTARHAVVTPALQAAVDAALEEAVAMLREAHGADAGPWEVITHRQAINGRGDHAQCPGAEVVAMACASDAVRRGELVMSPDLVLDAAWGKPWPASWRRTLGAQADCDAAAAEVDDLFTDGQ